MTDTKQSGRNSRVPPIKLEEPVLPYTLSEEERTEAVTALTDLLAAWWADHANGETTNCDGEPSASDYAP